MSSMETDILENDMVLFTAASNEMFFLESSPRQVFI